MSSDPSQVLASSGDYHLSISSDSADRFRRVIREFLIETDCCLGAVIERSGAVIASEEGNLGSSVRLPKADSLGVLAAGLFASTQMMAAQLGDEEAPEVVCHGRNFHIFLAPLSQDFALMAVFTNRVAVGLVRLHAKRAALELEADLQKVRRNSTTYADAMGGSEEEIESPFANYR